MTAPRDRDGLVEMMALSLRLIDWQLAMRRAEDILTAMEAAGVWQMPPKMTDEMVEAGVLAWAGAMTDIDGIQGAYAAMLNASPYRPETD